MSTLIRVALLGVTTMVAGAIVATPAAAAPAAAPSCVFSGGDHASDNDINGDGGSDEVVGIPAATSFGRIDAGAVDIDSGADAAQRFGESYFTGLPAAVAGDAFGSAITYTHLNADQCTDLAISAPGADAGRGAVTIALGSDTGISAAGAVRLSGRSAGEHFGSSIVARGNDLWISAPDRTVDGVKKAGAVDHYRLTDGTPDLVQTLTENTSGVHGVAETGDGFGRKLDVSETGPLLIGEPAEDVGGQVDAGTVTAVYDNEAGLLSSSSTFSQDSPGIPGTAEAGDHFGTSVSSDDHLGDGSLTQDVRVSVGVPGEALGSLRGAGTVDSFVLHQGTATVQDAGALSQSSPGVPGTDEAYDRFGKQMLYDDNGLCIAIPDKDVGRVVDAGTVLCHDRQQESGWETFRQGIGTAGGSPGRGSEFGSDLGRLHFSNVSGSGDQEPSSGGEGLLIAVPGANVSRVPDSGQVRYESRFATHDSAGPVRNERYGVLPTSPSAGPAVTGD